MPVNNVLKSRIDPSNEFFQLVFSDAFIFGPPVGPSPEEILQASRLSEAEQQLALRIQRSSLYRQETQAQCAQLCRELQEVFRWQSNSEGPLIFASKIWYFLLAQQQSLSWFKQRMQGQTPSARVKKKRATVILHSPAGILLTQDRQGLWLLPGGGVNQGELAIAAAVRELHEETRLEATQIEFLFEHESQHYLHRVFLVRDYTGQAKASSDALALHYLRPQELIEGDLPAALSHSNQAILQRYLLQPDAQCSALED